MTTAGIICEYNPFHNGHRYHIEKTREHGATHIVCVMSGNFVQRGDAACMSKYARAQIAVEYGADLVVELPLAWAVSGAQSFALGAVSILDSLKAVDILSFGSESGNINTVCDCAGAVSDKRVSELIYLYVGEMSYPSAVNRAVSEVYGEEISRCLSNPNDTLNVEYIRAIKKLGSSMKPFCVTREEKHDEHELSAMSIRQKLFNNEAITPYVPELCKAVTDVQMRDGYMPCSLSYVERAILSKLRTISQEDIKKAPDIAQGLENRIYKAVRQACSLDELYSLIKTKRYTMAKIRRAVLCLYLGVSADNAEGTPPYIRVLACNERGREILRTADKKAEKPVFTRLSELEGLSERCRETYALECRAGDLYALCSPTVRQCGLEMTQKALFI